MAFDGESFGALIVEQVRGYVERATQPLLEEIAVLKAQIKALGERPTFDATGLVPTEEVLRDIEAQARAAGRNGAEAALAIAGTPETRAAELDAAVARYFEANPVQHGKDGEPGRDGVDGKDADPVTAEQIAAAVERALTPQEGLADPIAVQVQRWMERFPPAAGKDGRDGVDGKDGRDGVDGAKGEPGADGVGLASALIDKDGCLVVTTTKGDTIPLGKVVGNDGRDGEKGVPGRDGLDLTGFDTSLSEDGRVLTLSLENDEVKVTHDLQLDTMIYRDVFKEGQTYERGDAVTWGGSVWIAKVQTTAKPDTAPDEWRLAVKKGRDGRDGLPGKDGAPGKDVKPR